MNQDRPDEPTEHASGQIVQSSLPEEHPSVVAVPEGDPHNETPTEKAAKLQQHSAQPNELIPSDEDG